MAKFYAYGKEYQRYDTITIKKAVTARSPVAAFFTLDTTAADNTLMNILKDGEFEDAESRTSAAWGDHEKMLKLVLDTTDDSVLEGELKTQADNFFLEGNVLGYADEEYEVGIAPTKEEAMTAYDRVALKEEEEWEESKKDWSPERREIEEIVDSKLKED